MRVHYGDGSTKYNDMTDLKKQTCNKFTIDANYKKSEEEKWHKKLLSSSRTELVRLCNELNRDTKGTKTALIDSLLSYVYPQDEASDDEHSDMQSGKPDDDDLGARLITVSPNTVEVSSSVKGLTSVNTKDGCFTVDLVLMLDWFDPDLVNSTFKSDKEDNPGNPGYNSWFPKYVIDNKLDEVEMDRDDDESSPRINDSNIGLGKITARCNVTLRAIFDVMDFPYDVHFLPIVLKTRSEKEDRKESYHHDSNHVPMVHGGNIRKKKFLKGEDGEFVLDSNREKIPHAHSFARRANWTEEFVLHPILVANDHNSTIKNLESKHMTDKDIRDEAKRMKEKDKYSIGIVIKRKAMQINRNVTFYVWLLESLCVIVWGYSPGKLDNRSDIVLQLVLAVMGFKYSIQEKLPSVSYQTLLDKYIFYGFMLLWLVGLGNVIIKLYSVDDEQHSDNVENVFTSIGRTYDVVKKHIQLPEGETLYSQLLYGQLHSQIYCQICSQVFSDMSLAMKLNIGMFLFYLVFCVAKLIHLIYEGSRRQNHSWKLWNDLAMIKKNNMKLDDFSALWDRSGGHAVSKKGMEREAKQVKKRKSMMMRN
jgi:hypothetical protein